MFGSGSFNIHPSQVPLRAALGLCEWLVPSHALKLHLPVKPEALVTLGIRPGLLAFWWAEAEQSSRGSRPANLLFDLRSSKITRRI